MKGLWKAVSHESQVGGRGKKRRKAQFLKQKQQMRLRVNVGKRKAVLHLRLQFPTGDNIGVLMLGSEEDIMSDRSLFSKGTGGKLAISFKQFHHHENKCAHPGRQDSKRIWMTDYTPFLRKGTISSSATNWGKVCSSLDSSLYSLTACINMNVYILKTK